MFDDVEQFLRQPLVTLSGTPVSVLAILTAVVIVVGVRLLAGLASRGIARVITARGVDAGIGFAIAKIVRWTAMVVGVIVALTTIGMNMSAVFAVFAVLLVGIGFGLQKVAENFLSGMLILIERPIRIGDFVRVGDYRGTVVDIGLRATRLVTRDGVTHFVPNSELITEPISNYTTPSTRYRVRVTVGVAYGTDLGVACDALLAIAHATPLVLADPLPELRLERFGQSRIELSLLAWIAHAEDDDEVASALRLAIAKEFAARGIAIPVPQREIRMLTPGARSTRRPESAAAAPRRA